MRFRRKKQGSSFIFVVIMFMFVIIVSTAMLSMVSGNYSARVSESKRVHNLYGAESGLDTAYNVAAKTVEKANIYAVDYTKKFQEKVEEHQKESNWIGADNNIIIDIDGISTTFLRDDIKDLYALYSHIDYLKALEEDKSSEIKTYNRYIDEFLNYIFKKSFKDYVDKNLYNNIVGNKNGNIQNGKINGEDVGYGEDVEIDVDTGKKDGTLKWDDLDSTKVSKNDLVVKYKYNDEGKIIPDIQHSIEFVWKNQTLDIKLTSNFTTDRNNTDETIVGKNPREIQVTFSVTVPNYDEVSFKNSITYPIVRNIPGLTVGGNMIVENSNLNVTGDIFVQGETQQNNSTNLSDKYVNGIKINSDSSNIINFNNNVYSRETFNIKNHVTVNIKGDLYTKNIYANSDVNTEDSRSALNINTNANQKAVVDNDLEMKAQYTDIHIKNFFGINEYTVSDASRDEKIRKSSSIIVNNQNSNSNITIENEAYIAGVAHIKTEGNGYQTGESVAVKGNYNAYSVPIERNDIENKENHYPYDDTFEYKNPLQLLEGELPQKSSHFYNYWKGKLTGDNSVDCGGVIFSNPNQVKSVGALVYKDSSGEVGVKDSYGNIETFQNDLKNYRKKYAWKIYNMSMKQENEILDNDYINPSSIKNSIGDMINFNADIEDDDSFIFNSNADKTIIITSDTNKNKYDSINGEKKIIRKTNLNAVIVTNGNVIIDGSVNFRGDIITTENLEISGNGNNTINLSYNPTLTKDIQNKNLSIFKQVFGDKYGGDDLNSSGITSTSNGASFLKTKQWRIIK